jgi:hypothetical protein
MFLRPTLNPETRRILEFRHTDRERARGAIAQLAPNDQVALVCEAPLNRRLEILDLLPQPEAIIPLIPAAELCFTVGAIGLNDAPWILEHATPEQIVACFDLDAWDGALPKPSVFDEWIDALAETGEESFVRSVGSIDAELVVLYLKRRVQVELKPNDDESWQPPEGGQTLDGQFYFRAVAEGDDLASIIALLKGFFTREYTTYFRMLQGVIWELDSQNEEWALRRRTARLEDFGFPPWDDAMSIYRFMPAKDRAQVSEEQRPLEPDEWHLPIWIPQLPTENDKRHRIFRAIEGLEGEERRSSFYAFVAVANKVAVADRMNLGDAECIPDAIEKAARFASDGLDFIAEERGLDESEVLRRVPLERLFRVGANLNPEAARPRTTSADTPDTDSESE